VKNERENIMNSGTDFSLSFALRQELNHRLKPVPSSCTKFFDSSLRALLLMRRK
jgi:hypothetical protein